MKYTIALWLICLPFSSPPAPYQLTSQILDVYQKDTTAARNTMASYAFSYNGEYAKALLYEDQNNSPYGNILSLDSLYFTGLKPVNAREYILSRAATEQMIIINEMHHVPLHRVFTESLLEALYTAGFRYFGAETLNFEDKGLNKRKYPVLESGYYTKEPQYGNLVRKALQLGFKVFAYEARTPEEFGNGKTRELTQAKNIQTILRKDPKAKILIHCGYDHVIEAPTGGKWEKAMAGRLKELTGIDPFTIDQVKLTEHSQPGYENPYYRLVNVKESSVLLNEQNEAFAGSPGSPKLTDVRVCHPRTRYVHGRPHWLLRQGNWKPYYLDISQIKVTFPCLAMAYPVGEDIATAVPMDVMEWTTPQEKKALILPRGTFTVLLQDEKDQAQRISLTIR